MSESTPPPDSADFWLQHWSLSEAIDTHFADLTPDALTQLLAGEGLRTDLESEALQSLENQVFRYGKAPDGVVIKLYRPGRWSRQAQQDEASISIALRTAGLPVLAPRQLKGGGHLGVWQGLSYALFDCLEGEPGTSAEQRITPLEEAHALGRLVGRMHGVCKGLEAPHRPTLRPETYGRGNFAALLRTGLLSATQAQHLREIIDAVCEYAAPLLEGSTPHPIHGDLHTGNLVWHNGVSTIIDFDDMVRGPAAQDLFVLAAGLDIRTSAQSSPPPESETLSEWFDRLQLNCEHLAHGYRQEHPLDDRQLALVPMLGILRRIWMQAWLSARRYDPRFAEDVEDMHSPDYWDRWLEGTLARLSMYLG